MARKTKREEKPKDVQPAVPASPPTKPQAKPQAKPQPAPVPVPVPAPAKPAPVPAPVKPPPKPPEPPKPTREELVISIGRQLLLRSSAWQNSGARLYNAQGAIILEHSVDYVRMCLESDEPAYRALVADAVRVEVFAR